MNKGIQMGDGFRLNTFLRVHNVSMNSNEDEYKYR